MKKPCVLISGLTIANDDELSRSLSKSVTVLKNLDNKNLYDILIQQEVDLVLLELQKNVNNDMNIIKSIKAKFISLPIILINGNGNKQLIAKAFASGVKDAFRKPYKVELIIERVRSLV